MVTTKREETLQNWLRDYDVHENSVILFATEEDLIVNTTTYGYDDRPILSRSNEADNLIRDQTKKIVADWQNDNDEYEGLLHIMTNQNSEIVYIGKTKKYGRDGNKLSANLQNLSTSTSKFARWGDGYGYHLGELSAAVLDHHTRENVNRDEPPKSKYQVWDDALFEKDTKLEQPVYLWVQAWRQSDKGVHGFENSLQTVERQLIDMASHVYPNALLNQNKS